MKICLVVDDYLPHSIKIGAKMMHELAVEFVRSGHTVTTITPIPELPVPHINEMLDGVTVCKFRSGKIKNVSKVKRAVNETLLSFLAWRSCRRFLAETPHDLIIYYSPTIFFGGLVGRLKKLWRAKSYLILRDFFPQWAIDNGLLSPDSPITKYFRFFEEINYRAADVIGVQSPKNAVLFATMTANRYRMDVLYNWSSLEDFVKPDGSYRQRLGLQGKVVFFYGGNIGHAQDMMNIVRLSHRMRDNERAHFLIVGKGDESDLIREAIDRGMAGNMTLLPAVSQNEYAAMLAEFDIGLFSLHRDHTTHNFPGKLLGYMLQRLPILGSINPDNDLKDVIENAGAGLVSDNGDDEAFYRNALRLLNDDTYRAQTGEKSHELLQNTFSVGAAAEKILAICK